MDTRRKFTDSKNDIIFDLRRKLTKLSRKTRFRTMASPGACGVFSTQHCSRTKHRSRILSYSFDLQSCLHKYKRLACRVCGNALQKFAVKFAQNADLDWSKSHEWWCSAVYNSISKQGRRSFSSLYINPCERLAVLNWRSSSIHPSSFVCSGFAFADIYIFYLISKMPILSFEAACNVRSFNRRTYETSLTASMH